MKKIDGKFSGKISLNDIEFSEFLTRKVEPANKKRTSGRIYLPSKLIDEEIYILVPKKKNEK
ncbi:hypothetical protein J4209_04900 [Candidatus Woesearchaeota archaeon]|nr:hypothetical protein [Candidatus Woesearchaeota archaeon]